MIYHTRVSVGARALSDVARPDHCSNDTGRGKYVCGHRVVLILVLHMTKTLIE